MWMKDEGEWKASMKYNDDETLCFFHFTQFKLRVTSSEREKRARNLFYYWFQLGFIHRSPVTIEREGEGERKSREENGPLFFPPLRPALSLSLSLFYSLAIALGAIRYECITTWPPPMTKCEGKTTEPLVKSNQCITHTVMDELSWWTVQLRFYFSFSFSSYRLFNCKCVARDCRRGDGKKVEKVPLPHLRNSASNTITSDVSESMWRIHTHALFDVL